MTTSRRAFVAGAAGVAAAGMAGLADCGGSGDSGASPTSEATTAATATGPATSGPAVSSPTTSTTVSGETLGKSADIPVGGGTVYADKSVVVTQPAAGTFKGFTAICTHRQCTVGSVSGGTINCPCHGSKYSITDGSVVNGPATSPRAAPKVGVSGDSIVLQG
jgi:Rieske Fe-S protein